MQRFMTAWQHTASPLSMTHLDYEKHTLVSSAFWSAICSAAVHAPQDSLLPRAVSNKNDQLDCKM
eukprot:2725551-Amphidinium_carterae.1